LAKIAVALRGALERRRAQGVAGGTTARVLAQGSGWSVADVLCTSGPQDQPFTERHTHHSIAIVLAGSFQYRSEAGDALMTPGSLLLGNPGGRFECGHEHAEGDRCLSFQYDREYFERLIADAGQRSRREFAAPRIPPMRELAPVVATAAAKVVGHTALSWEELAIGLAARAVGLDAGVANHVRTPLNAVARVTRAVRSIDQHPETSLALDTLARDAGLSVYHFLRTFERLTGVTPHQYLVRARLREAAIQLSAGRDRVLDIALDCGFGDVSNFNRAFRAEFGVNPRAYRDRVTTSMPPCSRRA
jgi:AraC family transcriptional regulator